MSVRPLWQAVPDVQTLLALEALELAGKILEHLCSLPPNDPGPLHLGNYVGLMTGNSRNSVYPEEHWAAVVARIAEAWSWLVSHGMLAPKADSGWQGWVFITRLGQRARTAEGLAEYRKALELPKERLHPAIAERCSGDFVRGRFDTAVFEAYKALEVAIRDAASLPPSLVGVALARKAFAVADGELTDHSAEPGEKQALGDLMAGALGSYKNPHSHRRVEVAAEEAVEMIVLASHLLRIVDARRRRGS